MTDDYEVVNEAIKAKLQQLGRFLKDEMPPGWGFVLLMFDYADQRVTDDSALFYLSSANRADVTKAMREFIRKQEPQ